VTLVSVGVLIGVVIGAALGIHAQDEGDMGGRADLTGQDRPNGEPEPEVQAVASPSPSSPEPADLTVGSSAAQQFDRLAQCESRGNWHINSGNGYFGGLQFDLPSWRAAGGSGRPDLASREEQIRVGRNWQQIRGWSAWPVCSRVVGLR
jgi:hypothetical protein